MSPSFDWFDRALFSYSISTLTHPLRRFLCLQVRFPSMRLPALCLLHLTDPTGHSLATAFPPIRWFWWLQVWFPSMRLPALCLLHLTDPTGHSLATTFPLSLTFYGRFLRSLFTVYYYFIYQCQYEQCDMILFLFCTMETTGTLHHRNPLPLHHLHHSLVASTSGIPGSWKARTLL